MKPIVHRHHIIPRHAGGTNDPDNLIELTIEEHAEAHRKLYEQYNRWQDKVAWQGLAGLIGHDDILREIHKENSGKKNSFYGKKHTEESKKKMSLVSKGKPKGPESEEHRLNKSKALKGNPKLQGRTPWNKNKTGAQVKREESRMKVSKPIIYNGVQYYGIKEAARKNNTTDYYIRKSCKYLD